jgi:hypothetical protein
MQTEVNAVAESAMAAGTSSLGMTRKSGTTLLNQGSEDVRVESH